MERSLGHDLSDVRVRDDSEGAREAQALGARALARGAEITFGPGAYAPDTPSGRRLLSHELIHVLQHRRFGSPTSGLSSPHAADEREAASLANGGGLHGAPVRVGAAPSAAVRRSSIAPAEPADAYLPDKGELIARLNALSVADRKTVVSDWLTEVQAHWMAAEAAGLTSMLANTRTAEARMPASATKPVGALPQNTVGAFREGLMSDAGGAASNKLGRDLVKGVVSVDAVVTTGEKAADAVMQLRHLDDTLTRILSAKAASDATGTPLPQVLAMYRAEGDLNAPASTGSLAKGIPPGTRGAPTSLNPTPEISQLVWLADAAVFGGMTDDQIREFALTEWFVQIGGLDQVGMLPGPRSSSFVGWSADNWLRARGASTVASTPAEAAAIAAAHSQAAARWGNLFANCDIKRVTSAAGTTSVMVTPKDSTMLVAGIVAEAIMLQKTLGLKSSLIPGVTGAMSESMSYLHYHAGNDQMQQILASAAIAASATRGTRYQPLRTAMGAGLDLPALRTAMTTFDSNNARMRGGVPPAEEAALTAANTALAADMWSKLTVWLRADAGNIDLLGDFVSTADETVWRAWQEHRGNLSRYNVLRAYYALL